MIRPLRQMADRELYAADARTFDMLHVARGMEAVEADLQKTVDRVNTMRATILATVRRAGWSIRNGISHFRFDAEGKVIRHQDFGDASAGFFEGRPLSQRILPRIRGGL